MCCALLSGVGRHRIDFLFDQGLAGTVVADDLVEFLATRGDVVLLSHGIEVNRDGAVVVRFLRRSVKV